MKKVLYLFVTLLNLILYFPETSHACTTFCLKDGDMIVYGRNFDFHYGDGFILINKRNVSKVAFIPPTENPAHWVSKYGSITFNQMAREFPMGGMNEKGLVVAQMWHNEMKYPEPDNRPSIGALQWLQYQLDNYASVREVISSDSVIRISNIIGKIHYLVCDAHGNAATIEFIDGQLVCHTGESLDGLPYKWNGIPPDIRVEQTEDDIEEGMISVYVFLLLMGNYA